MDDGELGLWVDSLDGGFFSLGVGEVEGKIRGLERERLRKRRPTSTLPKNTLIESNRISSPPATINTSSALNPLHHSASALIGSLYSSRGFPPKKFLLQMSVYEEFTVSLFLLYSILAHPSLSKVVHGASSTVPLSGASSSRGAIEGCG